MGGTVSLEFFKDVYSDSSPHRTHVQKPRWVGNCSRTRAQRTAVKDTGMRVPPSQVHQAGGGGTPPLSLGNTCDDVHVPRLYPPAPDSEQSLGRGRAPSPTCTPGLPPAPSLLIGPTAPTPRGHTGGSSWGQGPPRTNRLSPKQTGKTQKYAAQHIPKITGQSTNFQAQNDNLEHVNILSKRRPNPSTVQSASS